MWCLFDIKNHSLIALFNVSVYNGAVNYSEIPI